MGLPNNYHYFGNFILNDFTVSEPGDLQNLPKIGNSSERSTLNCFNPSNLAAYHFRIKERGLRTWIALSVQRDIGRFDYRTPKSNDPLVMLGQELEDDRSRYGVLISAAAGKIPYYAGGDCIDPFGLNDPYLATKQRPKFMPGHSAGSDLAAIEMARSHPSGVYATFSFLDKNIVPSPESISMWVDNRHPQDTVQRQVTQQQWDAALETGDLFIWSIISQPVQVSSQNP